MQKSAAETNWPWSVRAGTIIAIPLSSGPTRASVTRLMAVWSGERCTSRASEIKRRTSNPPFEYKRGVSKTPRKKETTFPEFTGQLLWPVRFVGRNSLQLQTTNRSIARSNAVMRRQEDTGRSIGKHIKNRRISSSFSNPHSPPLPWIVRPSMLGLIHPVFCFLPLSPWPWLSAPCFLYPTHSWLFLLFCSLCWFYFLAHS